MFIGVGKALVSAIIPLSEKANIWIIQSYKYTDDCK
jgi:hypothetical protein